jgi:transcriptional regulator with XRE-family HTH domain
MKENKKDEREDIKKERDEEHKNKFLIGDNIKRILKQKKMRQTDLANITGMTRQQVSCYATGATYPSTFKIIEIAEALRVEPMELFSTPDVSRQIGVGREVLENPLYEQMLDCIKDLDGDTIKSLIKIATRLRETSTP